MLRPLRGKTTQALLTENCSPHQEFFSQASNADRNQQFPERSLLACANVLATRDLRAGCSRCPKADLRDAGSGGSDFSTGGGDTLGGTGFAAIG